ncbi:MAG TPA: DUF58 domain-containing protein [Kofleriaceae bacterium]|nr:DUF58 domain-containing protein [Kofleriaceae bacterium]
MNIDRNIFLGLDSLRVAAPMPSAGGRPGDRRSRARGRGVDIADFRPYTPGDDLRLVDWNVFARLDAVLIKLFHEDRDLSLIVMVDASASMGFGKPRKIDHAGELAACLAFLALRGRERIRVVVAGAKNGRVRGDQLGALATIVQALELAEPDGTPDLAAALAAETERGRADHAVLLTDLLCEPDVRELVLRRLAAAARRPVLLHVLGDSELDPDLESALMIDSETGEQVPVRSGRAAKQTYDAELARWRTEIETRCRELDIIYAPGFTNVPARALIAGDLRRRRITEAARGGGR